MKNLINMSEKISLKAADRAATHWGGQYASPEVSIVILQPEGVLCQSGTFGNEDFIDGGSEDL